MPKSPIVVFVLTAAAVAVPVLFATETINKKKPDAQLIEIKSKVSMTDAAGKLDVIANPTVWTYSGQTASIQIRDSNGRIVEIELNGKLVTSSEANEEVSLNSKK